MRISSANLKFLFSGPTINVTQISPKLLRDRLSRATQPQMVCPPFVLKEKGKRSGTCISLTELVTLLTGTPEFPKLNFSLVDKSLMNKIMSFLRISHQLL